MARMGEPSADHEPAFGGSREEDFARPAELPDAYLRSIGEVERLPCNRPGQDKSWVLRAAENRRRFFRSMQRASEG